MVAFIVQARLGSTRLPGKILLPFYKDETILSIIIGRLKRVPNSIVIIATSDNPCDDRIASEAETLGVKCFRGDESDVLSRFVNAARENGVTRIIRVCSDNPFLDYNSLVELASIAQKSDLDYIGFDVDGIPSIRTHYGFWTEYVSLAALEKVISLTDERLYHEHVTNYIYTHSEQFKIGWIKVPASIASRKNIRLTIDTDEDMKNAARLYQELYSVEGEIDINKIVSYLDNHSEYLQSMKKEIEKNTK